MISVLEQIIRDNFKRYCICNGLLIYNEMLKCIKCKRSFHKKCVLNNNYKKKFDDTNYICHECIDRGTNPMFSIYIIIITKMKKKLDSLFFTN